MERYLEEDDVFELNGKTYITLDGQDIDGKYYIFVNQLIGGEVPSKVYEVFECLENGIKNIKDINEKNKVLKVFELSLNKKAAALAEAYDFGGDK